MSLLWCACSLCAQAQTGAWHAEIESVHFATTQPMPVLEVAANLSPMVKWLEQHSGQVDEGGALRMSIRSSATQFHLTPAQAEQLDQSFAQVYAAIKQDASFKDVPSAVAEIISQNANRPGHYYLYRPAEVRDDTRTIVLLHGFGGNLQFYLQLFKSRFPECVILCPSYGIAWNSQGELFLEEVLADARKRLASKLDRPWLVAISAGGPAGFSIYRHSPEDWSGLALLATAVDWSEVQFADARLHVLMLNGTDDPWFPISYAERLAQEFHSRQVDLGFHRIQNADHFFLLTRTSETMNRLGDFMKATR